MGICLWAVLERFMPIANIIEEMLKYEENDSVRLKLGRKLTHNLILLSKQGSTDAMNRGISPTLEDVSQYLQFLRPIAVTNLIIESSLGIQEFKKLRVGLAPPEVEVADLEIAPNYEPCRIDFEFEPKCKKKNSSQWQRLYVSPPSSEMKDRALSGEIRSG
jgi:hypothetical protein